MIARPQTWMPDVRRPVKGWLWFGRLAMLLPACVVIILAVPRLLSGFALEAAFPATAYLAMNVPLPQTTDRSIVQILSHAPVADGETQVLRAEAAADGQFSPATTIEMTTTALAHAPAAARGWLVLAELVRDRHRNEAASALSLAIELAPREYYLVGLQARAGAPLWDALPEDVQAKLLNDVRLVAHKTELRSDLWALLRVPGGPALLTRAFAGHPEQLRALNRSLAREKLGL
ncbi:MAG: hypothetical protein ACLQUZ_06730 [Rhizomicrobium sp.]